MATYFDRVYWKECWPTALLDALRDFMAAGDASGVSGLLCLSVCYRGTPHAAECAIAALVRQILDGFDEAEKIKQRLVEEELQLKAEGVYEAQKKIAELMSRGLVPLIRLHYEVEGYRKDAREIYTALKEAGFLVIEEHVIAGGRKSEWIGLNANWNGLIGDIKESGASKNMWASSAGIMLSIAVTGRGLTTLQPMYVGILAADNRGGEIEYRELLYTAYANVYQGKKALDIILERQREKTEPLKIWPSDDGKRLIVNQNAVYAVKAWRDRTNSLARRRGLGI